jgi:hypothetical protein
MDRAQREYKVDPPGEHLDFGCLKEMALLEYAMVKLGIVNNRDIDDMKGYKVMTDAFRYMTSHLLEMITDEADSLSKLLDLIED